MADLTGETLGKYRLVERLGRGGMAEVYKGYQPSMDRYVAIKLMHAYLAEDEDFVGRFKREARAIANLRHPHIVQAYDFDIEGDVYYMVQEYIEGGTLKDRLQEASARGETTPIEETVRIIKAVCSAIDYAHEQGRIHRDIKPDNIMFDADDRPVLTDFGIASIVGGTRFTATGAMIGTPAYMSPEQGKGEPNDRRSDIYSLGVVLYEMVTGRVPYDADTPFAVVLKHVNEALPMPSAIVRDLKPGIERVILRALAKEPEDRYQTAGALAQDLEEVVLEPDVWEWEAEPEKPAELPRQPEKPTATLAGTVIETEADQAPPEPAQRRRRWLWVAIPVVVVVLVGCCFVGLVVRQNRRNKAVAPATAGPVPTASADVASLIQLGMETLGAECDGDVDAAQTLFSRALEQDETAVLAYVGLGRCAMCNGAHEEALRNLDEAVKLAPEDATPYVWRGRLWLGRDEGEKARADLSQAIALDPQYVEAYFWRGRASMWPLEDYDQAFADMSKVIELEPDFAYAYLIRGQLYVWDHDDPDAALADFSRYVELEPDLPDGYASRGEVLLDILGKYEEAITEYSLAIERDAGESYLYEQRALAYLSLEQWDQAIEDYTRALDIAPNAGTYLQRGMANYYAERYDEALVDLDRALLIGGGYEGAAHHGRGWVLYAMGQNEDAIEAYTNAASYEWDDYAWPFFEGSHWLLDRGIVYRELGRFEEALGDHNALMDRWEGWFRPYYERALTYRAMGQEDKALADFRQALENADDAEWQKQIIQEMEGTGAQ